MPEVFISYASQDEQIAQFIHNHLKAEGVTAFLAVTSLQPGDSWSQRVLFELRQAKWVVLLASRAACNSPYVLQEIGAALVGDKRVVPIIWDIEASELPGWLSEKHVLNIRDRSILDLQSEMTSVAKQIKESRGSGLLLLGLIAAAVAASSK